MRLTGVLVCAAVAAQQPAPPAKPPAEAPQPAALANPPTKLPEKQVDEPDQRVNVFQPAPSDVRQPLTQAQKAVAEGRHADAAYKLGQLLMNEAPGDAETQDYFLHDADTTRALGQSSIKAETRRLLAALPPAGREAYELQFGAQARALLDEALVSGDIDRVNEVVRRFPQTRAGYEASMLAGRLELGRGRPLAAAICFQRVADVPHVVSHFEPELSILLATCWTCADLPDRARATLVALKQRLPHGALRLGDQEVKLFADQTDPLIWLRDAIGGHAASTPAESVEWILFRGNPQRNARTRGGAPVLNYRWRVPTPPDRADERVIEQLTKQYRDQGRAALTVLQPLAVGGTILMRTPQKLLGVDFRSGKRIWVWPPWDEEPVERDDEVPASQFHLSRASSREQELNQRIWDDAAYGRVCSDGQSVYLLHELGYAAASSFTPPHILLRQGGLVRPHPGAPRPYNLLVSLSLARQGAAQWVVGGEHGEDEPRLKNAFFLGPPLPLNGKLYILAEFNAEIRLVVLDARNGQLEWQQQLANVDVQTIVHDSIRRLAGATPSYAEGLLLCPTVAGALVAVDLATRSLAWGYPYLKVPAPTQNPGFAFAQLHARPPRPIGQRWADATVTVADGRVVLTALESDDLHCLDLLTGKPTWPPTKREDLLYLACIHKGACVFVGTRHVTALRLADGKPIWQNPVPLGEPPSGLGFYTDRFYYVPTAGAELLKIDLDQGEVAGRTRTSVVLGNLVCYRDEVLSQGPDWLATFPQSDPLRWRVEQALAQNPNDFQALASRGELLLQDGKLPEALTALEKAHALRPQDDAIRTVFVEAMLAALRTDFQSHRHYAEQIERLQDRPGQCSEYLRLTAQGWQADGQIEKAFAAYQQLARLKGELLDSGGSSQADLEQIGRQLQVRIDRWLQARIGELLGAANPAQRAALDRTIQEQAAAALTAGEISAFRRFLRYFGAHSAAEPVRLRLAAALLDAGELLEAELLLARLETVEAPELRAAATAELARLLEHGRQFERAAEYYRRLADQWSEVVCRDGKTGRQLSEASLTNRSLQEIGVFSQPWPYGKVTVSEAVEQVSPQPNYRQLFQTQLRQRGSVTPRGLTALYDRQRNAILLRNGWGQTLLTANLGSHRLNTADYSPIQLRANGHLVLASIGSEVIAIDLLQPAKNRTESVLWRRELLRSGPEVNPYQTLVPSLPLKHPWGGTRQVFADPEQRLSGALGPVCDHGVYYQDLRELVCADPLSGEKIWSRVNLPQGSDVFGDGELIFSVPPQSDQARVFSALDGRDLGVRKVDPLENRWATSGRRVLVWRQEPESGALELRLYDAWSGKDLWRQAVAAGSRATLVDCDEVAVLEPQGRLVIRSLVDDRLRVDAQLEPEKTLSSLHVLRSQTQYVVATSRTAVAEATPSGIEVQALQGMHFTPLITGNVRAFERSSGKAQWSAPAAIDGYAFLMDQPVESPLLVLLRHVRPSRQRTNVRQQTALLCLDRRDGRRVWSRDDLPAQTFTYEILADPRERVVTVALPAKTIKFKLTDEPIPPDPPAKPTPASDTSADARSPGDALELVDTVLRTFGGVSPFGRGGQ